MLLLMVLRFLRKIKTIVLMRFFMAIDFFGSCRDFRSSFVAGLGRAFTPGLCMGKGWLE